MKASEIVPKINEALLDLATFHYLEYFLYCIS